MTTEPDIVASADPNDPAPMEFETAAPAAPSSGTHNLRGRTIKSSIWTIGGYGAGNVFRLFSNLVLTRLFTRDVFGLMALINIFIQGLQMFSDVGIGPSIIQNPRADEADFLNTAWTIQVIRGCVLWACSFVIAFPLAHLYGIPELKLLIPAAGINALISGFNSTTLAQAARHLEIGKLTILELSAHVLGFIVTIAFCWWSRTVWAFIVAGLFANLLHLVVSHTLMPGVRNRFCWNKDAARELFNFGRWVFLSTVLTFFAAQSDRLIFGKMIPLGLLGVYGVALMLATLPTQAVLRIGSNVAFSTYSRVQDDLQRFRSIFTRVRIPLLVGGGLIIVGLIGCGPAMVRLLWPRDFWEAGWMLQILAAGAWFQILEAACSAAVLATGAAHWVALGNGTKLAAMCLFMALGYWIDRHLGGDGFRGAIVGVAASNLFKYVPLAIAAHRRGLRPFRWDLALTAMVALGAILAVGVEHWMIHLNATNLLIVLACGGAVCLLWLPLLYASWRIVRPAPAA
jgi:O-antigen/teichoic acid export membrane protein